MSEIIILVNKSDQDYFSLIRLTFGLCSRVHISKPNHSNVKQQQHIVTNSYVPFVGDPLGETEIALWMRPKVFSTGILETGRNLPLEYRVDTHGAIKKN